MTLTLSLVLYLAAAVCFFLAAIGLGGKVNLLALGLTFFTIAHIT